MRADRRTFLQIVPTVLAAPLGFAVDRAAAETYPSRPIRLVVPYPAGGITDLIARFVAQGLTQRLGQQVIVDNKPGGNTVLATQYVARAAPDGYTLYVNTPSSYSINVAYYKSLPYGRNDYTAIAVTSELPLGLYVATSSPFKTFGELVAFAKANPGKLDCGSAGVLTQGALAMEIVKSALGLDIQVIPYQGNAPAVVALLGNQVQLMLSDVASATSLIHAGRVRVLAVGTAKRLPALPAVPTFAEAGYPSVHLVSPWNGVFGPPGMPKSIVDKLNAEVNAIMASPEGMKLLRENSVEPAQYSAEKMNAMVQTDYQVYAPLLARLGLKEE
jgi:tripartite-type tricarboxylate transporter receptor subunit TctC